MLFDPNWENGNCGWRNLLFRAADIVRERGLAKGTQEDYAGRVCLHGAINIAHYGQTDIAPKTSPICLAETAVRIHLKSIGYIYDGPGSWGAGPWNNKPERTQAEVISALECAARVDGLAVEMELADAEFAQ